jgi:hypothetical protein
MLAWNLEVSSAIHQERNHKQHRDEALPKSLKRSQFQKIKEGSMGRSRKECH